MTQLKTIIASLFVVFFVTACSNTQSVIIDQKRGIVAVISEKTPNTGQQGTSLGTGFFVGENVILTNFHVVEGATKIEILMENNEKAYPASIIYSDKTADVAAIKLVNLEEFKKENNYKILTMSENYGLLDEVYAIGHPWGLFWSISKGVISRDLLQKPDSMNFFIQTDADVYNGNSGGPLFNSDGEVIGINSNMIANEGGSYGLAIPIILVEKILNDLEKYKEVRWAIIGIMLEEGNVVKEIDATKPAAQSGIKVGDKIVSIKTKDGLFPIQTRSQLIFRLSTTDYEDEVILNVIREDIPIQIIIKPTYKN